jgi:hypothetical protein
MVQKGKQVTLHYTHPIFTPMRLGELQPNPTKVVFFSSSSLLPLVFFVSFFSSLLPLVA